MRTYSDLSMEIVRDVVDSSRGSLTWLSFSALTIEKRVPFLSCENFHHVEWIVYETLNL